MTFAGALALIACSALLDFDRTAPAELALRGTVDDVVDEFGGDAPPNGEPNDPDAPERENPCVRACEWVQICTEQVCSEPAEGDCAEACGESPRYSTPQADAVVSRSCDELKDALCPDDEPPEPPPPPPDDDERAALCARLCDHEVECSDDAGELDEDCVRETCQAIGCRESLRSATVGRYVASCDAAVASYRHCRTPEPPPPPDLPCVDLCESDESLESCLRVDLGFRTISVSCAKACECTGDRYATCAYPLRQNGAGCPAVVAECVSDLRACAL